MMEALSENALQLSVDVEHLLVQRNLRGMKDIQPSLTPGYFLRAAQLIKQCQGTILIGTGFPVVDTFETDGPVGAIALYTTLEYLGANPVLVCGAPLSDALKDDYRVHSLEVGNLSNAEQEARRGLELLSPELIISIERPGLSSKGGYFNMRGEDISPRCASFDYFMKLSACPTIAIGDGGNEIGMGNIVQAIETLDIVPAVTGCDELLIADVSNWAAHGLIALLSKWRGEDLLVRINPLDILQYISARGSVDGVTRENTLTEDGLPAAAGEDLILSLRKLTGFA